MHPILLDFGWYDLPLAGRTHLFLGTYGMLFALSVLVGWLVWIRLARGAGVEPERLVDLGFYALLVGLAGSKAGLILLDPGYYLSSPAAFLSILRAAGVLLFGVVAGLLTIVIICRRHGLPIWTALDCAAPALALAQAIGRLGCLCAGCCYGRSAPALPWAVRFTDPAAATLSGTPLYASGDPIGEANVLHPTQIYQAIADFALFVVLLALFRRPAFPGRTTLAFIALYSLSRGVIEIFRGDRERGLLPIPGTALEISTSQIVSILGLIAAAVLWPRLSRRRASKLSS